MSEMNGMAGVNGMGGTSGIGTSEEAVHRALHELRRPLQALALGLTARPGRVVERGRLVEQIELAALAMSDLEAAVEQQGPRPLPRLGLRLRLRPLALAREVERMVARWRPIAAAAGRGLELRWAGARVTAFADPLRLAQALDNLIANALQHGSGTIAIEGRTGPGRVRLSVRDDGPAADGRRQGEPGHGLRHGHGLKVVAAVATAHGGRFAFHRSGGGSTATFELPLAPDRWASRVA